jgi:hypothetical protein
MFIQHQYHVVKFFIEDTVKKKENLILNKIEIG